MNVTRLKLANVRAVEAAEFAFKPGFNLIVGVNGVGKTTALDSLAVCLGGVTRHVNRLRGAAHGFVSEDIRASAAALTVECDVNFGEKTFTYLVHFPRQAAVVQTKKAGLPREQTVDTPPRSEFLGDAPPFADGALVPRPLAVLFSTRRAVPSDRAATKAAAVGGHAAAFADAFSSRELRLGEFAAWMRAQEALAKEKAGAGRVLEAFEAVVQRFLPGYANLRVATGDSPKLIIERRGVTVPVRQLSDGERGSLTLVLDLTRRLAQANPQLSDPAADGPAVVLIDEIDLHLHPRWQREIIRNLSDAFPKAQFIATTHSPQVIGEVPHERIQIMDQSRVYSPTHSYGVDSSRVLEEIMEAPPRAGEVQVLLNSLSKQVAEENFDEAKRLVLELTKKLGENDAEVIRARTLLDFLEGGE